MKSIKMICIVCCITILFGLCMNSGCDNAPYKTFTMEEGIASFSFEYSTRFKIQDYDDMEDLSYVTLSGPIDRIINDYPFMEIVVWANSGKDAQSKAQHSLEKFSDWPDFELLEKSEVPVAGTTGNLIAFMNRNLQPIDRELDKPLKEVERLLYFDYNDLVWGIQLRSDSSTAEADKADFQHVVDTFKILE